jgi:TM2 domain-containing membrane protein YozV
MSKLGKAAAEGIATIIGWVFCFGLLSGMYWLGWLLGVSTHLSEVDRGMFGLLSVLAFLWIYERREAHERYNRLCERLDRR